MYGDFEFELLHIAKTQVDDAKAKQSYEPAAQKAKEAFWAGMKPLEDALAKKQISLQEYTQRAGPLRAAYDTAMAGAHSYYG